MLLVMYMIREFILNAVSYFLKVCKTVIVIRRLSVIAVLCNVVKLILYNLLSFCLLCYLIGLLQNAPVYCMLWVVFKMKFDMCRNPAYFLPVRLTKKLQKSFVQILCQAPSIMHLVRASTISSFKEAYKLSSVGF